MPEPISKAEKKRRFLAALQGGSAAAEVTPAREKYVPRPATAKNNVQKSARDINGLMDRSLKATSKVIGNYVDENPDKALAVFRNWLSE